MNIIIEASHNDGLTWGDIRAAVEIGAFHEDLDLLNLQYDESRNSITGIRVIGVTFPEPKPEPATRTSYGPVEGDWRTAPQAEQVVTVEEPLLPKRPTSALSF